ncbi:RES domain-containing protein [Rosenbergiella collisarenosi]|uniref:RES domain-containing protein n=1 Tax=Rosenbergiella collisarenosi TaxID=1544695 RepID=UPI001F5036FE|nr:RES domain-containing protein [Rosenbergiella collisarenosi]
MESPLPAEIIARRHASSLTQTQAGKLVYSGLRSWQQWEKGDRKMPSGLWELFIWKTDQPRLNNTSCFDSFDESIGFDGYYNLIRKTLFPNSTESSYDASAYQCELRTYPKGTCFSRVRLLSNQKATDFFHGEIAISDFYPPQPSMVDIPEGRFNLAKNATMYLADHPYVAMKECNVSEGDFFLLSVFSLKKDMSFIHIEDLKEAVSSLFYELLRTKDKRFYPLINQVYSEFLSFDMHDGILYDSTKVELGDVDNIGMISSIVNLAIQSANIDEFKFKHAYLMICSENYTPIEWSIFLPLNNKESKALSQLNYSGNEDEYVELSNKVKCDSAERKSLLRNFIDSGNLKSPNVIPFKIIGKQ